MYFRYVNFNQSLDQIHVPELINYEIDENSFFLSESMRNVVIEDELSVPTTIDKSIYILIVLKQKKNSEIKLSLSF